MSSNLNPNDRLLRFLQASPQVQAEVDRILEGKQEQKTQPLSGPMLLGMSAAAKCLGVSRATLWRMCRAGHLSKVEILPGSYRIRRSDLENLVLGKRGVL